MTVLNLVQMEKFHYLRINALLPTNNLKKKK